MLHTTAHAAMACYVSGHRGGKGAQLVT